MHSAERYSDIVKHCLRGTLLYYSSIEVYSSGSNSNDIT
jgi:hypothetical protein